MTTPVTPLERLARIGAVSEGFVYAVTVTGTTGASLPSGFALADYLRRVHAASQVPVLAGFGVKPRTDIEVLVPPADGVVVVSALIAAVERGARPSAVLAKLRP